ncbi:MAG: hypothetical protein NTV48_01815, partial [Candidatus Vogelbacteria bacterium]|nr:hypothetical protein [Candidatus Vogelbacteria bacterium]
MFVVKRSHHNPVLLPENTHYWENFATFNLCVLKRGWTYYGLYRAISEPDVLRTPQQISVIGKAESRDGFHFKKRVPFIEPKEEWEKYGCEDPRVTYFEKKYYTFYTALSRYPFDAEGIKVAVAISSDLKKVNSRHLVTPFNAKAMTLFPERINGKVTVIFSAHTDSPPAKMCIAQADKIEDLWSPNFWEKWHSEIDAHKIDPRRTQYDHVEVGAPPIKTPYGWVLVYSHIQNYFPNPKNQPRVFGIEVLLLDLKNPHKIIGRTRGPVLVPQEAYEQTGHISDIVFPSGALIIGDVLQIYYGAADTVAGCARVNLLDLLSTIHPETAVNFRFKRMFGDPLIEPNPRHAWENKATFNPATIRLDGETYLLYRAQGENGVSTIGYAVLGSDGMTIKEKWPEPIYVPREDFEKSKVPGGNSGCEDPRLTRIGDQIYMLYTAFDGIGPARVALTSIKIADFLNRRFIWTRPFLITPAGFDDKDACLWPEKVKKKYFILHRINRYISADYLNSLDYQSEMINECQAVLHPKANDWESDKVGVSAPPIKTKYGWLLLYHGVSLIDHTYRVGVALLDLRDPTIVLARTTDHLLEPEGVYEKIGIVNNVVFPCGWVEQDGFLYVYYGGGDRVIGVATIKLNLLLKVLANGMK